MGERWEGKTEVKQKPKPEEKSTGSHISSEACLLVGLGRGL